MYISVETDIGNYIVIVITGHIGTYIAEVVEQEPLLLKVEEEGVFSRLKHGDYIICEADTQMLQTDHKNGTSKFLEQEQNAGRKVISGLKSLDVPEGGFHQILP